MEEHNARIDENNHLEGLQIEDKNGNMVVLHTVDPNDTLMSVSLMYNVNQRQIKQYNGLMSDFIGMKETLQIPMTEQFKYTPPLVSRKKTESEAINEERNRREMCVNMMN